MSFPYFYGRAAEQYAFYRIPKLLFSDERFEALSTDAKLLYGMLIEVQNELLGHAIERLTPYRQEIILLYFFLGFKNKEIAALYGCNAGKISYHKMRAVRQIRSEMEVRRHE